MRRTVHATAPLVSLALGLLLAAGPRAARADRAAAEAALPAPDTANPFLLVTRTTTTAGDWDDLPRLPEYAVYPDGTLLVQKSDDRLWIGRLSRDQTLDFLDFLLTDAHLADIDMTYIVSSPLTTFTRYTLTTRNGTHSVRRRASGGFGTGVKEGERALTRIDQRLFRLADSADQPYAPGSLYVVSRRVGLDNGLPVWSWNDRLPFAALSEATDLDRTRGAILAGSDAKVVGDAVAQGPAWRFGGIAVEFRVRPALPQETRQPAWRSPTAPAAPGTPPTPPPPQPAMAEPEAPPPPPPQPAMSEPPAPPLAPSAPATPPAPAPPPAPAAPAPSSAPPAAPAAGASDWRPDDLDFAGVQKLFVDLKRKSTGSPHAAFWTKPYEEFVHFEFALTTMDGRVHLLDPGHGANSNLVKALKGEPLTVLLPDGTTKPVTFNVMPPKGAPVPPADIERLSRWIDHGAPKERPAGAAAPAGTPPSAAPPSTAPAAGTTAPTGAKVPLVLVGTDELNLGPDVTMDDPQAPPTLFVATDEASWARIFDVVLPASGGKSGGAVAQRLKTVRDGAKGYDFTTSPLVLVVAPATDNYEMTLGPDVAVLSDGSGSIPVTHRHEARVYVRAPDVMVRWALYRTEGACPSRLTLADGDRVVHAATGP